jgi:hypothetical protein
VACFDLLSHLVVVGGVLCWVCLFVFRVCLCGSVRFGVFLYHCYFLYDIAVLLLLFKKKRFHYRRSTAYKVDGSDPQFLRKSVYIPVQIHMYPISIGNTHRIISLYI